MVQKNKLFERIISSFTVHTMIVDTCTWIGLLIFSRWKVLHWGSDAIPVSMVMTCEDAVEVTFTDGSRVQLSPCGSKFMYNTPSSTTGINYRQDDPRSQHPLYAASGIQQRTCFVTSSYRSKVTVAVEFRNRFATLPYLCMSTLVDERPLVSWNIL